MLSQSGPMCGEPFTCFPTTLHNEGDSIRFSVVPPPALTSLAPLPPIHCTSLPVWPSTRLLWPPPRACMCTSGSSGPAGLRSGVCCSARVPRSRREGHDQHVGPQHGPCTGGEPHGRRTTSRSCCGRPQPVPGSPVGHRHNVGVSCARRRNTEAPTRGHGKRSRIRSLSASVDVGLPRRHSSSAHLQHRKLLRRLSSHVAKVVGVFRGESFRWFFVGTSLSCLSCRSGPVGARRDS